MSVYEIIEKKLRDNLSPSFLKVVNESFMHNVPANSESHFKVVVVSDRFLEAKLITRHQMVNTILKEELNGIIHALSIETFTAKEWIERKGAMIESPLCLGGKKVEQT